MKPNAIISKIPLKFKELPKRTESILFDRNLLRHGYRYDKTLMWVLLCLLCFGLVMIYSASSVEAGLHHYDRRAAYLIKQSQYSVLGIILVYVLMRVPMWRWQRWSKYILIPSILAIIFAMFVGEEVNGARRWLPTPFGFKIQPSEIFKLATIIYMADFFKRKINILHDFRRVLFVGIPVIIGSTAIYFTRDLGSVAVIIAIFLALLFLANMPKLWFFGSISLTLFFGWIAIYTSEYRMRRVLVTWKPWEDPTGTGYQGLGSLMSLDNGGLFGKGLGNAIIKRGFLPEAETDFIAAVISEELGLLTVVMLILVYAWIIWRTFSIGKQARDLHLYFNSFIAIGIGIWIAAQVFIHIGVNISFLPNKGLTLPLVSYGGSSLLITMIAFTMLLRIDYENRLKLRGFSVADPKEAHKTIATLKKERESEQAHESQS